MLIAIFLIPVTYYVVERFADRRGERAGHCARWRELSGSASRSFAVWRAFVVFRRFFGVIYRETLSQQGR
jgi:hypothetical protein